MGNSKTKPEQSDSKEPTNANNSSDSQLQIRNCIRNVRASSNFSEMYPNEAGTSCGSYSVCVFLVQVDFAGVKKTTNIHIILIDVGQANRSSVYTIDVHGSNPSNFTNAGYVTTENGVKSQSNDGLPTYEEAIASVKQPITPTAPEPPRPTVEIVNEESENVRSSRGRRHRHHRRHRNQNTEQQNEQSSQPDAPEEQRRQRHRRGFRLKRHLAKMNRRHNAETD